MKPNYKDIIQLRDERKDYYDVLHKEQRKDDDYYELVYNADVPDALGYSQATPPFAREWVDFGINQYTLDNPLAVVPPMGRGDEPRKQAARLESFYNAWLSMIVMDIKQAMKKLLVRGETFLKLWIDDYYYGEEDSEEIADRALVHFPLKTYVPDPINVFASPAQNGLVPVDVIEHYQITKAEADHLCERNGWTWKNDEKKPTEKVSYTAYYSSEYRCVLLDDEPVMSPEVAPNILGFCPYVHIPSGYGNTNYEGKPEYLYRSLLYKYRNMIELVTRNLSQLDAINSRWAWPRVKISGDPNYIKQVYGDNINLNPDEPIVQAEGTEIEFVQGEQPTPALYEHFGVLSSMAQPPKSLGGKQPTGVYSGEHFYGLTQYGKSLYKHPFKNFEDGLSIFLGLGARVVDKVLKQNISIRMLDKQRQNYEIKKVGPDDIKGYYYNEIQLLSDVPEATDIRKTLGANLQKSGVISHRTNLLDYQNMTQEQAEEEEAQIVTENALKNPVIAEAVAMDAVETLGLEKARELIEQAGTKLQRGGARREPENYPTGGESVPQRKRQQEGTLETMPMPGEQGG